MSLVVIRGDEDDDYNVVITPTDHTTFPDGVAISTASLVDVVTDLFYDGIMNGIELFAGARIGPIIPWIGTEVFDCDSTNEFPTIAVTVYQNMHSRIIGKFYIEPPDYTTLLPEGRCIVHIVPQSRTSYHELSLGSNCLQSIVLFFDNDSLAFCDPLA